MAVVSPSWHGDSLATAHDHGNRDVAQGSRARPGIKGRPITLNVYTHLSDDARHRTGNRERRSGVPAP